MSNDELIKTVLHLQKEFEGSLGRVIGSAHGPYYEQSMEKANIVRGLYEGALRLAQDRGISLENFFDYKEEL